MLKCQFLSDTQASAEPQMAREGQSGGNICQAITCKNQLMLKLNSMLELIQIVSRGQPQAVV